MAVRVLWPDWRGDNPMPHQTVTWELEATEVGTLLRFADDVSLTFQPVARTFALYSDGRDLIRLRETGVLSGGFPPGFPYALSRYPPGDTPISRLKARLKAASEA